MFESTMELTKLAHTTRKIVPERPISSAIAPHISETAFETDIAASQIENVHFTVVLSNR
jgi:hypothetical protein